MNLFALKTLLFQEKDDLFSFFIEALQENYKLKDRSVVIIASKIVALSQSRVVFAEKDEIEQIVRKEAQKYWRTNVSGFFLALKDDILIANAGADFSNTPEGKMILWPENPQRVAEEFRTKLQTEFGHKELGVLIMDSRCTPLRAGVSGVALAWSGFEGVVSEIGKEDLHGKPLEVTKNAVADNLASASQLLIGSGAESTPFVICEDAPVAWTDALQRPSDAVISFQEDLFAPLWNSSLPEEM